MNTRSTQRILAFDGFELDRTRGELRRDGSVVGIEPQVFELLWFFATHPCDVLSHDAIIDEVWGGRFVSNSVVSTRINAARKALGDDGRAQRIIRTIPRRGYEFQLPVTELQNSPERQSPQEPSKTIVKQPMSIVVLPLENLSDDPEQAYFSDGITDDLITELTRYKELFVIGRQSSFAYRSRKFSIAEISSDLGVKFVLHGTLRWSGDNIRVSVQLVEAETDATLWAERYDRVLSELFAVQDEITGRIVNTLVGELDRRHVDRSAAAPSDMGAYDYTLRAKELLFRVGLLTNQEALAAAEKATYIDPGYARAYAMIAWAHITSGSNHWVPDVARTFDEAYHNAGKAVGLDDQDPWGHCATGWAHIWRDHNHPSGLAALERAVSLNPGNAHFLSMLSWGLGWSGSHNAALANIEKAIQLNPHYPALYLIFRARAMIGLGRIEEAVIDLQRHLISMPDHTNAHLLLSDCLNRLGRSKEAAREVESAKQQGNSCTLKDLRALLPFGVKREREQFLTSLKSIGIPEE